MKIRAPLNRAEQARLVALDPCAAAEWFDAFSKSIIEWLFGGGATCKRGLFGSCKAYAAVKETYGRGSLHGHYLLWVEEVGCIQHLLRNKGMRGRYETRVGAFVNSVATCNLNAVSTSKFTTEVCHSQFGDDVRVEGEAESRALCSRDVGKQVHVTMRPTKKTARHIHGTVSSVRSDGWYAVERHSSAVPSHPAGISRVAGADVDFTHIRMKSGDDGGRGVPFYETACAPVPALLPGDADMPAFGEQFMQQAEMYGCEVALRVVGSEAGAARATRSKELQSLMSDLVTKGAAALPFAKLGKLITWRGGKWPTTTGPGKRAAWVAAWEQVEGPPGEAAAAAAAHGQCCHFAEGVVELSPCATCEVARAAEGPEAGAARATRSKELQSLMSDLVTSGAAALPFAKLGKLITWRGGKWPTTTGPGKRAAWVAAWEQVEGPPGEAAAAAAAHGQCCHCAACGVDRGARDDDPLCATCREGKDNFMKPFLTELGGIVTGGLQHGKRVSVPAPFIRKGDGKVESSKLGADGKHPKAHGQAGVDRCLRRRCLRVCFKYANSRQRGICRLGYTSHGRLVATFTHIGLDGKIVPERNSCHVVPHNVGTTIVLRCNNAVELLFTGKSANAISLYITSYMVKGELDSHNTFTILAEKEATRQAFAPPDGGGGGVPTGMGDSEADLSHLKESYQSMVGRFVNTLHGSVDMPAQYMATISLGLPLEYTSHKCTQLLTFRPLAQANSVLAVSKPGRPAEPTSAVRVSPAGEETCPRSGGAEPPRVDSGDSGEEADDESDGVHAAGGAGKPAAACPRSLSALPSRKRARRPAGGLFGDEALGDGSDSSTEDESAAATLPSGYVAGSFVVGESDSGAEDGAVTTGSRKRLMRLRRTRLKRLRRKRRDEEVLPDSDDYELVEAAAGLAGPPSTGLLGGGSDGASSRQGHSSATKGHSSATSESDASTIGTSGVTDDDIGGAPDPPSGEAVQPAAKEGASGTGGHLATDGAGKSVVVGALEDYKYRVAEPGSDQSRPLEFMSMVQFTMQVYKRRGLPGAAGEAGPLSRRFALASGHAQKANYVLAWRRGVAQKRVFVFVGPVAKPADAEAYAQFVLTFFKPWHGDGGLESLLLRSGARCTSWGEALNGWTLPDRRRSDPLWYEGPGGVPCHPYLDNMAQMFEVSSCLASCVLCTASKVG